MREKAGERIRVCFLRRGEVTSSVGLGDPTPTKMHLLAYLPARRSGQDAPPTDDGGGLSRITFHVSRLTDY